jgi:hypothetical protein
VATQFTQDFFCVYGFSFCLRTNHPDAREAFARLYRRFVKSGTDEVAVDALLESNRDQFLWRLREKTVASLDLNSALLGLESALCEAIIRSQQSSIAVHAAALYSVDSVVLLVGPSGAGKSTLSLALSRRGMTAATDDVTLVDPKTLRVLPIPRPFHLDRQSVLLLEGDRMQLPEVWKRLSFMAPIDLDEKSVPQWRAGLLIFITGPRTRFPHLKPVSQSEMAARLLSETGEGPLTDSETVRVLSRVCGGASCFTLVPGPFAQTADALGELILRPQKEFTVSTKCDHAIAAFGDRLC